MTIEQFFSALLQATSATQISDAIAAFTGAHPNRFNWTPFGKRPNNRGVIEVSTDPGRSLVERVTNGIDGVLEAEFEAHSGRPVCRTPKEAATAWLNIPNGGLSDLSRQQRQTLAKRVQVIVHPGEGKHARTVEVRDYGVGIAPGAMPDTILSLNESNKMQKHYLAGAYGQGGSSTLAVTKYVVIATRSQQNQSVGFTVASFEDLPPEEFKTGRYVYLADRDGALRIDVPLSDFQVGTLVRHVGYDLGGYPSPLGPNSVYGLLNQVLFDPVIPIWLDDRVQDYRRVIKGSRNALNGAVDEGDGRGPALSHNMRMFYVDLGDYGQVGIEYWVLDPPQTDSAKIPIAAFVNPRKPIILTINGQNHAELPQNLVRKEADLPYLAQRLICHVDCDNLTPAAKRILFVSNREEIRRGAVADLVHAEVVKALRSDDELARLNNEAREASRREQDETITQQIRQEVARLLRLQGVDLPQPTPGGGSRQRNGEPGAGPNRPPRPPTPPRTIELRDPPTYVRIVSGNEDGTITFYPGQRKYIRIETDAHGQYHNTDPVLSRFNFIVSGGGLSQRGSTPLKGGRLRLILDAAQNVQIGANGTLRVELSRPGLPTLSDERRFAIVEAPLRPASGRPTLPPFDVRPVSGFEDPMWATLAWPEDVALVASSAIMEEETLVVYYSEQYPHFATRRDRFAQNSEDRARSFTARYRIWLAVHSLMYKQDLDLAESTESTQANDDVREEFERKERCRIAAIAALMATRELQDADAAEATAFAG